MASSLFHCFVPVSSHSSITRPLLHKPFISQRPLQTTLTPLPLLKTTTTPKVSYVRTRAKATPDGEDQFEQKQHGGKMKYYHPSKLLPEMVNRAIKANSPVVGLMALHVTPGFAGVTIATLDMTGTEKEFLTALADSLSWDSLAEKLPYWISEFAVRGIIVSHLPLSPTAPRYLKEQHDLVEKLSKVEGIEDGLPYTFEEQTMIYYDPAKMFAMISSRAIEKRLPSRFMCLDLRPKSVAVSITTPDNARVEVLSPDLSWEQLSEKLPDWISEYSIGGIVLGNLTSSPIVLKKICMPNLTVSCAYVCIEIFVLATNR